MPGFRKNVYSLTVRIPANPLATCFLNVTGFSFLTVRSSPLDTGRTPNPAYPFPHTPSASGNREPPNLGQFYFRFPQLADDLFESYA
jgi:hypothetical protein